MSSLPTTHTEKVDPIIDFCCLLLCFQWDKDELRRCGLDDTLFRQWLARMREELLNCGLIEEAAV